MKRKTLQTYIAISLVLLLSLPSCKKDKYACDYPPDIWNIESSNLSPDVQSFNLRDASTKSSYSNIEVDDLSNVFVSGWDNHIQENTSNAAINIVVDQSGGGATSTGTGKNFQYFVAKLNGNGTEVWYKRPGFEVRSIQPISYGTVTNGIMCVGYVSGIKGGIAVFKVGGQEVYNVEISDPQYPEGIWFNSLTYYKQDANGQYWLVAGGAKVSGIASPYIAILKFSAADQKLTITSTYTFSSSGQSQSISTIAPTADGKFIAHLVEFESGTSSRVIRNSTLHLTQSLNKILDIEQTYSNTSGSLVSFSGRSLITSNSGAYLIFNADDTEKTPPSNGGYWSSGNIKKIDNVGNLLWSTKLNPSNRSDRTSNMCIYNDMVYVGGCSQVSEGTIRKFEYTRGNACIWKINQSDGTVQNRFTYNPDGKSVRINSIKSDGSSFYIVGYSGYVNDDCGYKSFYAKISASKL